MCSKHFIVLDKCIGFNSRNIVSTFEERSQSFIKTTKRSNEITFTNNYPEMPYVKIVQFAELTIQCLPGNDLVENFSANLEELAFTKVELFKRKITTKMD